MFDVATVIFILVWELKNNNIENSMILSLMSMVTMSIILFVKEATIYSKGENNVNVKSIENIFEGSWSLLQLTSWNISNISLYCTYL